MPTVNNPNEACYIVVEIFYMFLQYHHKSMMQGQGRTKTLQKGQLIRTHLCDLTDTTLQGTRRLDKVDWKITRDK